MRSSSIARVPAYLVLALLRLYQYIFPPFKLFFFGARATCRFHPTCSQYCYECFRRHPFFRALYLSARRLLRCHPFHPGGSDPAPGGPARSGKA